jgi:hypothetical protein
MSSKSSPGVTSTVPVPRFCTPLSPWLSSAVVPASVCRAQPILSGLDNDHRPPRRHRPAAISGTRGHEQSIHLGPEHFERIRAPPGLVEHQEPGVSVELLERLDPAVNRRLGRKHQPRQAEVPTRPPWWRRSPGRAGRARRQPDRRFPAPHRPRRRSGGAGRRDQLAVGGLLSGCRRDAGRGALARSTGALRRLLGIAIHDRDPRGRRRR